MIGLTANPRIDLESPDAADGPTRSNDAPPGEGKSVGKSQMVVVRDKGAMTC